MKVIGISGLENAVPFRKARWPGLEEREYRIAQGTDAAAALVIDGRLAAAAEQERFNGKIHTGAFPIDAIQFCLAEAGVSIHEIDEIAHGFDFTPYLSQHAGDDLSADLYNKVLSRETLLSQIRRELPSFPLENVYQVNNHLAHAANAAYTSGWDECLVVVNDAMGEADAISVYIFRNRTLEKIGSMGAGDSIGALYSLLTLHLGYEFNADDYKVMSLAPHGDPLRFRTFFQEAVQLCPDGSISIPMLKLNRTPEERASYTATRAYLDEHLIARRAPNQALNGNHQDVAAALQECLERAVVHVCEHFGKETGLRKLALAGGVALNSAANGRLRQSALFDHVYAQPVANNAGTALGAALYRASLSQAIPNQRFPAPFFGPRYKASEIEAALYNCNGRIAWKRYASLAETCAAAAKLIDEGRIVAWCRGRMVYGPHALGNRSILANPGRPEMCDRINSMVKSREFFRPFAPAITLEEAHRWFEVTPGAEFPYMNCAVNVRPEVRDQLPAVTAVNGSARLQTVSVNDNPDFHALLVAVGRVTGRQMVLNTSFGVEGQPMVNTPEEAIVTFLGTGVEHLFLENFHVTRPAT